MTGPEATRNIRQNILLAVVLFGAATALDNKIDILKLENGGIHVC